MAGYFKDPEDEYHKFADDAPVNQAELAIALRTTRWTVRKWVENGYEFQFGTRTTPGHCRRWLEANRHRFKRKPTSPEGLARVRETLARSKSKKKELLTSRGAK